MSDSIRMGNCHIGHGYPPFIIAEMSGNHNQSLEKALQIVDAAAGAGADAVKLQTYTADTLTIDERGEDFVIADVNSPWKGLSLYELYQQAHTPWDWHTAIFERCKERGLICFSTPFDETAVDFLEKLNVPAYKIASFENNHLPLIKKVASTGKPIIISCGMASVAELDETVSAAREAGCKDIVLLKCTSSYPARAEDVNLLTLPCMRDLFSVQVGLSDHTTGIGVSVASVALGASVIEKHLTISRSDGGPDVGFSMEPDEFKMLVTETRKAWRAMGRVAFGPTGQEKASLQFRRSLYIVKEMKAGEALDKDNVRVIRPGFGLAPKYYDVVLGKKISRSAKKGTPLRWELVGFAR